MLKFLQDILDWWHGDKRAAIAKEYRGKKPWTEKELLGHDFVDPAPVHKRELALRGAYPSPSLEEALEIVKEHYHVKAKASGIFEGEHRDHKFSAAPNADEARHMQPPDLRRVVEDIKGLFVPFLFIAIHRDYGAAAHGWCNGSNYGRYELESLARCAELNIKQELAKCGEYGGGRRPMPVLGEGQYKLSRGFDPSDPLR